MTCPEAATLRDQRHQRRGTYCLCLSSGRLIADREDNALHQDFYIRRQEA